MKKLMLLVIVLVIFLGLFNLTVQAHNGELSIMYDNCMENGDLKWYSIMNATNDIEFHPSVSEQTIKYYIADNIPNVQYSWNTDFSDSVANEIKQSLSQSMKKWNDIYFYKYMSNGLIEKCKVINVVEGSANDFDLIIYPIRMVDYSITAGTSRYSDDSYIIETREGEEYKHTNKWQILVDVKQFAPHDDYPTEYIIENRSIVGAHEFGHILGLDDLKRDNCGYDVSTHSHSEVLMGYGTNNHVEDITYQDLAGVAITRGFHTDSDHRWLKDSNTYNGEYKLICSICNGVKYVSSLSGYTYYNYGSCNESHALSSNNMLAVGCNGDKDYIKCKYCRYVAPVEDMVTQSYTYQTYDSYQHKLINNVSGLSYTIYEDHILTPLPYNQEKHRLRCTCGYVEYQNHSITETDYSDGDSSAQCIICKGFIDINTGIFDILPNSITQYSINGSYILPNGIVVLVEEDIQSYLNNTLIFYKEEDLPQIE